jgi:hypothetical protein
VLSRRPYIDCGVVVMQEDENGIYRLIDVSDQLKERQSEL